MNNPHLESGRLVYSLGRDRTYHFVTIVLLALGLVVSWLSSLLTPESVREEFDASAPVWAVRGVFLLVGWSGFLAWLWWMRRYVRLLTWLPQQRLLVVERFGWFIRRHQIPVSALRDVSSHEGISNIPEAPSVHAPYRRLKINGLPPLILDDQGQTHDAQALDAILEGREPSV